MSLKNIAIAATAGIAILGTAGAAYAATTSPSTPSATPSATPTTPSASATPTTPSGSSTRGRAHHRGGFDSASFEHGQFVRHDSKTGKDVTYDVIRGDVTAVTSNSISVKSQDGTTATFSVSADTKVRAGRSDSSISQVKTGEKAMVIGTGTSDFAATRILVRS